MLDLLGQFRQDMLGVADHRDVDVDVLGDAGRVDVDVDDLRIRRECAEFAGDAIVETGADRNQQVRFLDRVIGVR